jgi:hypothetical protein
MSIQPGHDFTGCRKTRDVGFFVSGRDFSRAGKRLKGMGGLQPLMDIYQPNYRNPGFFPPPVPFFSASCSVVPQMLPKNESRVHALQGPNPISNRNLFSR